jgi:hypothetical protein
MSAGSCTERARVTVTFQWLVLGLAVCLASPTFAQTPLESYVARCKSQLGFETLPRFDCRGENFRPRTNQIHFRETNDWVNYRRVTDAVDAVFACRWVDLDEGKSRAASGEMIVHNRYTGDTCFFELRARKARVHSKCRRRIRFRPRIRKPQPRGRTSALSCWAQRSARNVTPPARISPPRRSWAHWRSSA